MPTNKENQTLSSLSCGSVVLCITRYAVRTVPQNKKDNRPCGPKLHPFPPPAPTALTAPVSQLFRCELDQLSGQCSTFQLYIFFTLTSTFQLLGKPWGHRCCPFFAPVLAFDFYRAEGSAIPLLVDVSSSVVANSRSRAFRKSVGAQEKIPTIFFLYE